MTIQFSKETMKQLFRELQVAEKLNNLWFTGTNVSVKIMIVSSNLCNIIILTDVFVSCNLDNEI